MRDPASGIAPFVVGWEEWLALPDLGLPAIRAKIDTGAKTSALHAFAIDTFGPTSAPMVRFGVHPIPGREDIARYCTAQVVDRREVTSSNGDREYRFVIRTRLVLGQRDWGAIEATLTNRENMAYRMLLGRQALRGVLVDPAASFHQPKLSHRLYAQLPPQPAPLRQLRIALVAGRPERPSNRVLQESASALGHHLDVIALGSLAFDYSGPVPRLMNGSVELGHYDAAIVRAAGDAPGLATAALRHLQRDGAVTLNDAEALERLRNPHLVTSALHRAGLPTERVAGIAPGARALVVAGEVAAADATTTPEARSMVIRAANALGLGLVSVEIGRRHDSLRIGAVDPFPRLSGFGKARQIAKAVITALEARVRTPAALPTSPDGEG